MGKKPKRQIKGRQVRKLTVSIYPVTDVAVSTSVKREGLTYSGALCALATAMALQDAGLAAAIHEAVKEVVEGRFATEGGHPELSAVLAREVVTGETEKLTWN